MDKGFSLVEALIVIGIMAILAGLTAPSLVSTFSDYELASEKDLAGSLIRKARQHAFIGLNNNNHGIKIASSSFIEFEGLSYATRDTSKDIVTDRDPDIIASGSNEIVFNRISGRTSDAILVLFDGFQSATISINQEGLVSW